MNLSLLDPFKDVAKINHLKEYANHISREAGPYLAEKIGKSDFFPWERLIIAEEWNQIKGFCTFTKEDWIPDCPYSPFIGFVFVDEEFRGQRLSEKMIHEAEKYAKALSYAQVYIVSDHQGLYEKYWYTKCDVKTDEFGRSETIFVKEI